MESHQKLGDYMSQCREWVSPVLFSYLRCKPKEYEEIIKEYPKRMGKYLRPALVLLSTQLHGADPKMAIKVGAAMQASEEWLLIHDDAEDHSTERRSTPTQFYPSLNEIFGWELAINAGDTIHAIMWKIIGDFVKETSNWQVFDKFFNVILQTTEGQYQELNWIHDRCLEIKPADYLKMIDQKTAYYTIIGPIQLGALIAGSSQKQLKSIEKFALPLGRAFQLKDDVIGLTVETNKAGKEQYGDINEGKRTLIVIDLLQKCNTTEREYVKKIYRSVTRKKKTEEIDYVVGLMKKYKSIEYVNQQAIEYGKEANVQFLNYCKKYNLDGQYKSIMLEMINFIVNRVR